MTILFVMLLVFMLMDAGRTKTPEEQKKEDDGIKLLGKIFVGVFALIAFGFYWMVT